MAANTEITLSSIDAFVESQPDNPELVAAIVREVKSMVRSVEDMLERDVADRVQHLKELKEQIALKRAAYKPDIDERESRLQELLSVLKGIILERDELAARARAKGLHDVAEKAQVHKLDGVSFKVEPVLEIRDAAAVPAEFLKSVPDTHKIRAAIADGQSVPGVHVQPEVFFTRVMPAKNKAE